MSFENPDGTFNHDAADAAREAVRREAQVFVIAALVGMEQAPRLPVKGDRITMSYATLARLIRHVRSNQ
jgi:hypothetical protein